MALYRLYVDENGNGDLKNIADINQRFLGLTGIITGSEYYSNVLQPDLVRLKKEFFQSDADEKVIFHRKEMVNCRPPFQSLKDETVKENFNGRLLELLAKWEYTVITIVIDKKAHCERYNAWRYDPYHYCFELIIERYALFLKGINCQGDVMVESRGGKEDRKLENLFDTFYTNGTRFFESDQLHKVLTSKKLKIRPKEADITGLQVADIIAHPSYKSILIENELIKDERDTFGKQIVQILKDEKYRRSHDGRINGYGTVLLPNNS